MKRSGGFTLIELLIVLAVIAALLATVTPVALNAVKKAKATQVAENLRNIKTAIEQYTYTEQELPLHLASLTEKHYLSKKPDGYFITVWGWSPGGTTTATVTYFGGGVDPVMVHKIYPEATVDTAHYNNIYVRFHLAKYW